MRMIQCSAALLAAGLLALPATGEVVLKEDFQANEAREGAPAGWGVYKTGPNAGRIAIEERDGKKAVIVDDSFEDSEIGITRQFPVQPGRNYRAGLKSRLLSGDRKDPLVFQLRFRPSNKLKQVVVNHLDAADPAYTLVSMAAPEGSTHAVVYIYTHNKPKPAAIVEEFVFEEADGAFDSPSPWKGEKSVLIKDSLAGLPAGQDAPAGWRLYKQGPQTGRIETAPADGADVLRMVDAYADSEIGISRSYPLIPGAYYRASVEAKAALGADSKNNFCFLMQLSAHPSKSFKQVFFRPSDDFVAYSCEFQAPEDGKNGVVYLYSHRAPTGEVLLRNFKLETSYEPFAD